MKVENPILPGFNPDPSIVRVGPDYYLATSTFEWFPGVQLYHSTNLVEWTLIGHGLTRSSQANLIGLPDSCGVWAPCLSYCDGTFYLVYSVVQSFDGVWKDTPNYLITASDPRGPWSEPVYLSSRGFDGSLFHHEDGSKWFLSMLMDHRQGLFFGGIQMQEYDLKEEKLIGPVHYLTAGSELGMTEGPHLVKRNDFYYLVLAEGGTEYGHAVSIARSKNFFGPYEFHPKNPLISSRETPDHPLQRAGHGDLVESPEGDWYIVFLVGRPLPPHRRCIRGRETALEEIIWEEDWPFAKSGSSVPRVSFDLPGFAPLAGNQESGSYRQFVDFSKGELPLDFQALRRPIEKSWCWFEQAAKGLVLKGEHSLSSLQRQSFLARRVAHLEIKVSCQLQIESSHFQHMAGLVLYYNTGHYHYLYLTKDEQSEGLILNRITVDNFVTSFEDGLMYFDQDESVLLGAVLHQQELQFLAGSKKEKLNPVGEILDASILSDDYVRDGGMQYRAAFTGCFVGIACQDLAQNTETARFHWFDYTEL